MATNLEMIPDGTFAIATYPPGATFGPRRLPNFEFVWMIGGNAEYTRDNDTFAAPEGSITLCRPGSVDSFRWDKDRGTRHGYFHFDLRGDPPNAWGSVENWATVRTENEVGLLRPLFEHLLEWGGQGDATQTRSVALSLLAVFVTGQSASADVSHDHLPQPVEDALRYIAHRLDEQSDAPIMLKELAAASFVTPGYLCRLFAALHHSPMETVRLARLERAVILLARTNYNSGEISALCGFANPFHFSPRIKAVYGVSPRVLRERIASGEVPPLSRLLRIRQKYTKIENSQCNFG